MSIQAIGLKAYSNALNNFSRAEKTAKAGMAAPAEKASDSFADVLQSSLSKVNDLQMEKDAMVTSFASGETQNVHELMITMQKAGLAMNMTAAVRNKVMEAYKELSHLQF